MRKLTRDDVMEILVMVKDKSLAEMADHFGVTRGTIQYWIRRLRAEGFKVVKPADPRKIRLK